MPLLLPRIKVMNSGESQPCSISECGADADWKIETAVQMASTGLKYSVKLYLCNGCMMELQTGIRSAV